MASSVRTGRKTSSRNSFSRRKHEAKCRKVDLTIGMLYIRPRSCHMEAARMGNHIDQEKNWQKGILLGPMFPVGSMFHVPSHAFTERVSFSLPMDSHSRVSIPMTSIHFMVSKILQTFAPNGALLFCNKHTYLVFREKPLYHQVP